MRRMNDAGMGGEGCYGNEERKERTASRANEDSALAWRNESRRLLLILGLEALSPFPFSSSKRRKPLAQEALVCRAMSLELVDYD